MGRATILFGINEPLLSFEWTYDVSRLAKQNDIDVVIETNGFSTVEAIDKLAPYVDAVDVGVKGHLNEEFYRLRMRSDGAVPAVKDSIRCWYEHGVHLIVGDLVPPPQWVSDVEFEETAARFYAWLAENVDPLAPVLITTISEPGPQEAPRIRATNGWLLGKGATAADARAYGERLQRALDIAHQEGLAYAHLKSDDPITCHNCGGTLLQFPNPCLACDPCTMPTNYCAFWEHEQHVTDSRCDHCGVPVPIVTQSPAELEAIQKDVVRPLAGQARSTRHYVRRSRRGETWIPLEQLGREAPSH